MTKLKGIITDIILAAINSADMWKVVILELVSYTIGVRPFVDISGMNYPGIGYFSENGVDNMTMNETKFIAEVMNIQAETISVKEV